MNFVNAKQYKWENANLEKFIQQNTNNPAATYYPKGELVITKDLLKGGNNLRLAWKFTISSLVPNNEQWIYVDAASGEVIRNTPLIYDVNTPCTAETRYSGTLGITGDSFAGGFRLRENRNNVTVQTLNLQGTFNYANAIDFANANTNFTNGNWPNFNQDQAALDAHWGAENVLDYWRVVHNRNSIDGNGIQVIGYVHYFQANSPAGWPNNAQWDGTNHVMRYGDGDGIIFNPLTALDVCAHEMGHGITQFTAALTPGTQESGALNEGFSDIYGACVEHWAAPNKQTWLIGEEVMANGAPCLRSLINPKTGGWAGGSSTGGYPNTYHGQYWDNNGEPHTNSTVLSHWFYLLSQGGNGTNDLQNTYSVNGIGINDAQLIAYRTELFYLNSSADYVAARNNTIQSARDLFGTGSCQEIVVTNAWFAVGVGAAYTGNAGLSISGDNVFCTTSNNYTIPNLPNGATVQWQVTPVGIATPNTPTSTQTTLTKNSDGIITLTATVTNSCGNIMMTKPNITVGAPVITSVTSSITGSCNGTYQEWFLNAITNSAVTSWLWTVDNPANSNWVIYSPNQPNTLVAVTGGGGITISATNACGTGRGGVTIWSNCYAPYALTASPNPASGNINVRVKEAVDTTVTTMRSKTLAVSGTNGITKMHLYNFYTGLLVKEWTYQETESDNYNLNIVGVQAGLYVLEMERNNKMCSVKVIVK